MTMFHNSVKIILCAAFLVSCAPAELLRLETGTFHPSTIDKEVFFHSLMEKSPRLKSISGRASVQVSEPGLSERLIVTFRSDWNQSLLILRNTLGMEGGRIYSDPDSVLIVNRLESLVYKMSRPDAATWYLNGIAAMNLIEVLQPVQSVSTIDRIYENEAFYLVETTSSELHYFDRSSLLLYQTEIPVHDSRAYHTFRYEGHIEMEGFYLPRRVRILSKDEKSNIFMVIRALELNPDHLDFDPAIPEDLEIIRI